MGQGGWDPADEDIALLDAVKTGANAIATRLGRGAVRGVPVILVEVV